METDLKLVRQTGRASIFASLMGIVVPFACGVALGDGAARQTAAGSAASALVTALFLGTALVDRLGQDRRHGGARDELPAPHRRPGDPRLRHHRRQRRLDHRLDHLLRSRSTARSIATSLAWSVIGTFVFMVVSFTVGRRAVFFAIRWVNDTFVSEFAVITAILVIMGTMALTTDLIGVHTVLGAFVAGILVGESPILTRHIDEQLRGIITAFFTPVFFGIGGLAAPTSRSSPIRKIAAADRRPHRHRQHRQVRRRLSRRRARRPDAGARASRSPAA